MAMAFAAFQSPDTDTEDLVGVDRKSTVFDAFQLEVAKLLVERKLLTLVA